MNREEHLAWCKARAIEYIDAGDLHGAFASMVSDLHKHAETADHAGIMLGTGLLVLGHLNTKKSMREFIDGFN